MDYKIHWDTAMTHAFTLAHKVEKDAKKNPYSIHPDPVSAAARLCDKSKADFNKAVADRNGKAATAARADFMKNRDAFYKAADKFLKSVGPFGYNEGKAAHNSLVGGSADIRIELEKMVIRMDTQIREITPPARPASGPPVPPARPASGPPVKAIAGKV